MNIVIFTDYNYTMFLGENASSNQNAMLFTSSEMLMIVMIFVNPISCVRHLCDGKVEGWRGRCSLENGRASEDGSIIDNTGSI